MALERYQAQTSPSAETEIRRRALPSWETVEGMLELRTHNNAYLNSLIQNNRPVIKEYYEAELDIASKKGSDRLNAFMEKYDHYRTLLPGTRFETEPWYVLNVPFRIVRQSLGLERKRTSKGFAKHIRAEKSRKE